MLKSWMTLSAKTSANALPSDYDCTAKHSELSRTNLILSERIEEVYVLYAKLKKVTVLVLCQVAAVTKSVGAE